MKRVLVIDVNKDQKRPMFIMFDNAGIKQSSVMNHDELKRYLASGVPDLVVVDWDMRNSQLKPTDFMPSIRAIKPCPKLVFITSSPKRNVVMQMDSMDPDLILVAPLSAKIVKEKITPLLKNSGPTNYEKRLVQRKKIKDAGRNAANCDLPTCYTKISREIDVIRFDAPDVNRAIIESKIVENNLGYYGWLSSVIITNNNGLIKTRDQCIIKSLEFNPLNIKLYNHLLRSELITQVEAEKSLLLVLDNLPLFDDRYQMLFRYVYQLYKRRFLVTEDLKKRVSYILGKGMNYGFN